MNPDKALPQAVEDYYERSTLNEQYQICLEFLQDKELYDELAIWRDERGQHEFLVDAKKFAEEQPGFDAWLVDCKTESKY